MKPFESRVAESIPGLTFADRALRSDLIALAHVSERLETRLNTVGGAVVDFLAHGALDDAYSTDVLLEELEELHRNLVWSSHQVANARGRVASLRMERIAAVES